MTLWSGIWIRAFPVSKYSAEESSVHIQRLFKPDWWVLSLWFLETFRGIASPLWSVFQTRRLVESDESVVIWGHFLALNTPVFAFVDSSRNPLSQVMWRVDNGLWASQSDMQENSIRHLLRACLLEQRLTTATDLLGLCHPLDRLVRQAKPYPKAWVLTFWPVLSCVSSQGAGSVFRWHSFTLYIFETFFAAPSFSRSLFVMFYKRSDRKILMQFAGKYE